MKIRIKNRHISLWKLFEGDVLIFPDRAEIVEEVDLLGGALLVKRIIPKKDRDALALPEEFLYGGRDYPIEKINKHSIGRGYLEERMVA